MTSFQGIFLNIFISPANETGGDIRLKGQGRGVTRGTPGSRLIGGDAIEARRHVPPQILGSGGTLERASSDLDSFVIVLALTTLS